MGNHSEIIGRIELGATKYWVRERSTPDLSCRLNRYLLRTMLAYGSSCCWPWLGTSDTGGTRAHTLARIKLRHPHAPQASQSQFVDYPDEVLGKHGAPIRRDLDGRLE